MGSSSTLRALKPYLQVYRIVGLIQCQFFKKQDQLETVVICHRWSKWNIQSMILVAFVSVFFIDRISKLSSNIMSDDRLNFFESINGFIFAINVLLTTLMCSTYLSKRLCRLVDRMVRCEEQLKAFGCQLEGNNIHICCWTAMAVSMSLTIFNEFWYIFPKVDAIAKIHDYQQDNGYSFYNLTHSSFKTFMAPVVALIWPFVEFSIIQVSLVLSFYLRHLRIQINRWSSMDILTKERLRQIYWNTQRLIQEADKVFSPLILFGNLACLSILVLQINIGVNHRMSNFNEQIPSVVSFLYLVGRFVSSSYFAEIINQELMSSLKLLHHQSVEEQQFNELDLLMTKRLMQQLVVPTGFSGCRFFFLGKRYLITVCGSVITYEMILIDMTAVNIFQDTTYVSFFHFNHTSLTL